MEQRHHTPLILQPERKIIPNFMYFPQVFSLVECKRIIEIGNSFGVGKSILVGGAEDSQVRNSSNSWIPNTHDTHWIFLRLNEVLTEANYTYRFDVSFFGEPLQFTRYDKNQYYKWHTDNDSEENSVRKLSLVTNLTDHRAYSGGELQIFSAMREKIPNDLGGVIVFPSFKEHRVTSVKEGIRHSLVSWVSGPAFR